MKAQRHSFAPILLLGLALSVFAPAPAPAALVFLSTVAPGGGATVSNPSIMLAPGASTVLYVYFAPEPGDAAFIGIGLDLRQSLSGVVTATDFTVPNPSITVVGFPIDTRWNAPTGGTIENGASRLIRNMVGVSVTAAGLDGANTGVPLDGGYDATAGAFHFATFTLTAGLSAGTTDLSLAVGSTLIGRTGDTAATPAMILFGDGADAVVSGLEEGATGLLADATITVIPEPAGGILLLLGGTAALVRRRRGLSPLLAAAFIGFAFIGVAPEARAGFTYNPGFEGFPLGDGTATPGNTAKIAPTKARIGVWINAQRAAQKPPLAPLAGAALAAEAEAKFNAVRANVASMLELVACQIKQDIGATEAACGKALLDKGSICIDFGNASRGAQYCDTAPACEKDKININISEVPCTVVTCYDPQFYACMMTLYEEVRHALQDWTSTEGADANETLALRQLKAACNEAEVDEESIPLHGALCAGLENIGMGQPHGQTEPIVMKILDKLAALPAGPAKDAAIAALKARATKETEFDLGTQTCYLEAKLAILDFLLGGKTFAEMNACLGKIRWQIPGQTTPINPRPVFTGSSTSGELKYSQGAVTETIPLGLAGIYDIEIGGDPGDDFVLVSGVDSFGLGTVYVLRDTDNDGLFFNEPAPVQMFPASGLLGWTLELIPPSAPSGDYLILDGASGMAYPLQDLVVDGIPDALGEIPVNPGAPFPGWVRHVRGGEDAGIFFLNGYEPLGSVGSGNHTPEMEVFRITSVSPNGPFGAPEVATTFGEVSFAPTYLVQPRRDLSLVSVMAMPFSNVLVFRLDPLSGQPVGPPLGNAFFNNTDELQIPVNYPLVTGALSIILVDNTHNLVSNPIPVLQRGDMNHDGMFNVLDIDPFVLALTQPLDYFLQSGLTPGIVADINGDGEANALDIDPFVQLVVEGEVPPMVAARLAELLPNDLDSDADGMADDAELVAGTDRHDPGSRLRIATITVDSNGSIALEWPSVADRRYAIEMSADGRPGSWTTVSGNPVAGTGGIVRATVVPPDPPAPAGLFRVRVVVEG